jgi:hypothetical protein
MRATWMAAGVLALAATAVAPTAAQAEVRVGIGINVGNDHGYRRGRETFQIGYDRGLEDGMHRGRREARRSDFDFRDDRDYRRGDAGYRGHYGPKHEYVSGYRRGYEQGYRRAFASTRHGRDYDRNDRYDRDGRRDDDRIYEEPRYRR